MSPRGWTRPYSPLRACGLLLHGCAAVLGTARAASEIASSSDSACTLRSNATAATSSRDWACTVRARVGLASATRHGFRLLTTLSRRYIRLFPAWLSFLGSCPTCAAARRSRPFLRGVYNERGPGVRTRPACPHVLHTVAACGMRAFLFPVLPQAGAVRARAGCTSSATFNVPVCTRVSQLAGARCLRVAL